MEYLHDCEVFDEDFSFSTLPPLHPASGCCKKFLRRLHKSIILCDSFPTTKLMFRSFDARQAEKRRHADMQFWYVIHPLSSFNWFRECIMSVIWFVSITFDFLDLAIVGTSMSAWYFRLFRNVLDSLCVINVGVCFFLGYVRRETNEVILHPKAIAWRYFCTFFFVDSIPLLPCSELGYLMKMLNRRTLWEFTIALMSFAEVIRLGRIPTMMKYFRRITDLIGLKENTYTFICFALWIFLILLISSGITYAAPSVLMIVGGDDHSTNIMNVRPYFKKNSTIKKYYAVLSLTAIRFYRAGPSKYLPVHPDEILMTCILNIVGALFFAILIVTVVQMLAVQGASSSKYEDILFQLNQFMITKKLPIRLRERLLLFFEYRFQNKYFRERAILSSLSDSLRYEIYNHNCRMVLKRVSAFKEVSKHLIMPIAASLQSEVYLPNDVVAKINQPTQCIYFLSTGTVATYTSEGDELIHMQDGDMFGENAVLTKSGVISFNYVCVEACEIYKLSLKNVDKYILAVPELRKRFFITAAAKYERLQQSAESMDVTLPHQKEALETLKKEKEMMLL